MRLNNHDLLTIFANTVQVEPVQYRYLKSKNTVVHSSSPGTSLTAVLKFGERSEQRTVLISPVPFVKSAHC